MKKIILRVFFAVICFFMLTINCYAKENVKLYFFHGDGCPHCKEESEYLKKLSIKYPNMQIEKYEVWYNKKNQKLMQKVKNVMNIEEKGVPLTIIGNTYIVGYSESLGMKIDRTLNYYSKGNNYTDTVYKIKNGTLDSKKEIIDNFSKQDKKTNDEMTINIPIIGKVNMKNVSLYSAAATIGFVDGFNPCAMWVLLFLISILIGMKDNKRKWIIGITFLISSALVYMAIMFSWINIVVNISTSIIFRYIISVVAIIGAFLNIRSYINEKKKNDGCEVIDSKKRKKILTKIKDFTREKSLFLAILGVIGLAISVNVVELACSAGLPIIFTQLLTLNGISGINSIVYMLIYILFFLIDDIIVFMIAMLTTNVTAISTKYNKYSHLIGGILMLIIGLLLVIKPEWLMFNFS